MTCDRVKTSSTTVLRKVTAMEQDTDRRIVSGIFEPVKMARVKLFSSRKAFLQTWKILGFVSGTDKNKVLRSPETSSVGT